MLGFCNSLAEEREREEMSNPSSMMDDSVFNSGIPIDWLNGDGHHDLHMVKPKGKLHCNFDLRQNRQTDRFL